jgi:ketosteroid isomerase-like protein
VDERDDLEANLGVANRSMPDGGALRVVGCFIGTVGDGRITRLEEYVDGRQASALSALLKASS